MLIVKTYIQFITIDIRVDELYICIYCNVAYITVY